MCAKHINTADKKLITYTLDYIWDRPCLQEDSRKPQKMAYTPLSPENKLPKLFLIINK